MPVVYLGLALVHGVGVLYGMEGVRSYSAGSGKTIQVIGHQWYWEYVLGGCKHGAVESRMVGSNNLSIGHYVVSGVRLTSVDQPVYIGSSVAMQVGVTSADVIHCWSVPGLGIKLDGIPGRMSLIGMQGLVPGVYSGYCAELCGSGHAFMPIQVVVYDSVSNVEQVTSLRSVSTMHYVTSLRSVVLAFQHVRVSLAFDHYVVGGILVWVGLTSVR